MDEILKKIDEEIEMYRKRIEVRQGPNYHDESERMLRFEERMNEAIRIKEIILAELKEKTNFDIVIESPTTMINYFLETIKQVLKDNDCELEIEPDAIENWLDYLSQKVES